MTAPVLTDWWTWSLSTQDGEQLNLWDVWSTGITLADGPTGIGMPPVSLSTDALPLGDGSIARGIRYGERDVFLPLVIVGDNPSAVSAVRRNLERFMNARRGMVTIHVAHPGGDRRSVTGIYVGGLEGDYSGKVIGRVHQFFGVTIRCPDPYWYGEAIPDIRWFALNTTKTFLSTTELFFPVELNSSIAGGSVTVRNDGDVDAEPIWTITGPGSGLEVGNEATGEMWALTQPIADGQTVVIDTRAQRQTVFDATTGTNLFSWLAPNPSLWHLRPGANEVTVDILGANADTTISLSFRPRYLSAG